MSWTTLMTSAILAVAVSLGQAGDLPQGSSIVLWECGKASHQKWVYKSDSTIRLAEQANGDMCVDIKEYGTSDGSLIWLCQEHTDDHLKAHQNQEWTMNSDGSVTSNMSGKCIDIVGGGAGSSLQLYHCTGSTSQKWTYSSDDQTVRNGQAGLCLTAFGNTPMAANCSTEPLSVYPYCNMSLPAEQRAMDLVSRLTLSEKVSMMKSDNGGVSRLGLPSTGHTECTHGTLNDGKLLTTLFPQAITVARSFDRDLVHTIGRAISDEVRAKHNTGCAQGHCNYPNGLVCWAPVVNICRDPRWGRCQEGYGEDPYLQAEMSFNWVQGLQEGPDKDHIQAGATCKHFDVHTGPENIPSSRFSFDSVVSYRDWIETFQPAFRGCGKAGAISYMCSYNAINGVPACANWDLLTGLLREKWNFTGFVVSDCGAVGNVNSAHHYAGSQMEAAEFCVRAGCDWECGGTFGQLTSAVTSGYISEKLIDRAVVRQLTQFIRMGELDPDEKVPYRKLNMSVVDDHRDLARQAAEESIVLLENRNNALPLEMSGIKTIALIGPCIQDETCNRGDYDPQPKYIITPMTALQNFTSSHGMTLKAEQGCKDVTCGSTDDFKAAAAAAQSADVVIYVGGINKGTESEGRDRSDIALPNNQAKLVAMLKPVSKKLIIVMMHGAPTVNSDVFRAADALLSTGYGGQEAGNALVSVLTGAVNPSGRLSVTWYTGNDQLPSMTDYDMHSKPGRTYKYLTTEPLYRFGYGLSYTTFKYGDLSVPVQTIKPCDMISVKFTVTNSGSMPGDEVVQVYLTHQNASVPVPNLKLVEFTRLKNVKPGAAGTMNLQLNISPTQMTVIREEDFVEVLEPGTMLISVGGNQPGDPHKQGNILQTTITMTGEETPLSSCNLPQ